MRRLAAVTVLLAVLPAGDAAAAVTGPVLQPAQPQVTKLRARPQTRRIDIAAGLRDWRGRLAHIAGSAHYDRGEWIYEDYPITAYGAALPGVAQAIQAAAALGQAVPAAQRLPGGLAEVQAQAGAGPLVAQADLAELRLAVRGPALHVLARTTTMTAPVRTALLLLFDSGRAGGARQVPFGSGLTTSQADVAALVTAAGARIVDLASGETAQAPAAADAGGYDNALQARLPLALVRDGDRIRLVAAAGLAAPGSMTLEPGGAAGPLAKVAPRLGEPVQAVHDRAQALALSAHDIDRFFTTVSLARLRRGDRERLRPGSGYTVRTFDAPEAISQEGGTDGILRDYGLYVPRDHTGGPTPATMVLRGSGMTAHSLAAITPGLFQQLGDDNHAIVVSPGGRSAFDDFAGAAYRDALGALDDAQRLLPIDRDRVTVAGYSMGGYATYVFAATQPDRFAAALVIEGAVGGAQPATKTPIVDAFPDVLPALANVFATPVAIDQTEHDADTPITNALTAAARLRDLGYRYRLTIFPGDHFTPGLLNDYGTGARYLRGAVRDAHPAEVHLTRDMPFERAVDTALKSDSRLAGRSVGLRFDHAWYVHDLEATDPHGGTAAIDVRTLARPRAPLAVVRTAGLQYGTRGGEPPAAYDEQRWQRARDAPPARNAFTATVRGAAHVTLDLAAMRLSARRPVTATVDTGDTLRLVLRRKRRRCRVTLAPGRHELTLRAVGSERSLGR